MKSFYYDKMEWLSSPLQMTQGSTTVPPVPPAIKSFEARLETLPVALLRKMDLELKDVKRELATSQGMLTMYRGNWSQIAHWMICVVRGTFYCTESGWTQLVRASWLLEILAISATDWNPAAACLACYLSCWLDVFSHIDCWGRSWMSKDCPYWLSPLNTITQMCLIGRLWLRPAVHMTLTTDCPVYQRPCHCKAAFSITHHNITKYYGDDDTRNTSHKSKPYLGESGPTATIAGSYFAGWKMRYIVANASSAALIQVANIGLSQIAEISNLSQTSIGRIHSIHRDELIVMQ